MPCVQLRQDNLAGDHFSLVGFQTQMKWGEQARVLRLIPGLENAEFVRFGMIHRNTYINGPDVLRDTWQMKTRDDLFFAGQISGVEGYVESAASGLMAGRNAAALVLGQAARASCRERPRSARSRTTSRTPIRGTISRPTSRSGSWNRSTTGRRRGCGHLMAAEMSRKETRKLAMSERALADLERWMDAGEARVRRPSGSVR